MARWIRKTLSLFEWLVTALYAGMLKRDFITGFKIHPVSSLRRIGSEYGGWIVPVDLVPQGAVCYLVGVGEDITFDLGLIARFGCQVYAFDPTPRARQHVSTHAQGVDAFHFYNIGVWREDGSIRFYAHANPASTSFSITNLHQTSAYFEAPCKRLSTLMREHGHERIDLLKLDVEGAEYEALRTIIEDRLNIGMLFVEYDEFHSRRYAGYRDRIRESVALLQDYGFILTAIKPKCNYTFIHRALLEGSPFTPAS